jgi:hypothetical protein
MKMNWFAVAAAAAALALGTTAQAQQDGGQNTGRPRFDPAQMQQQMMDRVKESLEITDDQEWKAVQPLVQKVMDARMQAMAGGRGMFGMGGRRGGGGPGGPGGQDAAQGGQRRFGPPPSPEAEALQKAIDAKAPKAELKAAVEKYQAARKSKQAELEKAQEDLRKVLTARQEAIATVNGWL